MAEQRITVPAGRMVFGDNSQQMIDAALATMPASFGREYQAAVVMACPVSRKGRLTAVWSIGKKHVNFSSRHYGKVTFTLKGTHYPKYEQISLL